MKSSIKKAVMQTQCKTCVTAFIVFDYKLHRGQNLKQINIAKCFSIFLIYGAKMLDKCVKSQKKNFCTLSFFYKVKLGKMASIKTNSTFLIQFFMIYNFSFGAVEIPHL